MSAMLTRVQYDAAAVGGDVHTIAAFFTQQAVDREETYRASEESFGASDPSLYNMRNELLATAIASDHVEAVEWVFSEAAMAMLRTEASSTILPPTLLLVMRLNKLALLELLLASPAFAQLLAPPQQQAILDRLLCSVDHSHGADVVELLAAHGARVNPDAARVAYNSTALRQSATALKPELVDAMVRAGAFVVGVSVFNTAFLIDEPTTRRLLSYGTRFPMHGTTALHRAAASGFPTTARTWLELGFADVDARNASRCTPLMLTTWLAHCPRRVEKVARATLVTKLLLQYGADVSAKDEDGWTPLRHALCSDLPEIVRLLLEGGADPNQATTGDRVVLDLVDLARVDEQGIADHLAHLLAFRANPFTPGQGGLTAVDRLEQTKAGRAFLVAHPQWFPQSQYNTDSG